MATLRAFMKRLTFTEQDRALLTFSDSTKIMLDPALLKVRLRGSPGSYPLDEDLYVVSAPMSPQAVRAWIGFQADVEHGKLPGGTPVTSVGFRLHDGAAQWYWDGADWVQGTDEWNTEEEIATNLAAYDATTTRTLRIVVNLATTDARYTPLLIGLRLAYNANLRSELEDLTYRTLVPALRTQVRPVARFVTKGGGTVIDFAAVLSAAKTTHNVVGVDAVYNETDDPDHFTDLLASYNTATKQITLSGPIASGKTAFIEAVYEPEVVFEATSPDYIEVGRVPAIVLSGLSTLEAYPAALPDSVTDKAAADPTILVFPAPYRMRFRCDIIALAAGGVDLQRLADAVVKFFEDNVVMRTTGTDEPFRLRLVDEFTSTTTPTPEGLHSSQGSLAIDAYFHPRRALTSQDGVYPIKTVKLTGDVGVAI